MKRFIALFLMMLITLVIYTPAYAASFVVSTEAEFRAAIAQANDEINHPGADTILLAGDFTIVETAMLDYEFVITSNITIDGQGFNIACESNFERYLFKVNSGANLTLTNLNWQGVIDPSDESAISCRGIDNDGVLSILNSDISYFSGLFTVLLHNRASGVATIANSQIHHIDNWVNGALYNEGGILTISNSTFSHNEGFEGPSAIMLWGGILNVTDTTFEDNLGSGWWGQGILIHVGGGNATFTRSHFLNNPGGIDAVDWDNGLPDPLIHIIDSEFIGNNSQILLSGTDVIIEGSVFQDNAAEFLLIGVKNASISDTEFVGNSVTPFPGSYGAIIGTGYDIFITGESLTIENSIFQNNTVQRGGVLGNYDGNLTIKDSLFIGNNSEGGGAIYLGILGDSFPDPAAVSNLTVIDTEITNNIDTNASNGVTSAIETTLTSSIALLRTNVSNNSGGINTLGTTDPVEISVTDSTFANNIGNGAIHANGEVKVVDSSFTGNSSTHVEHPGILWVEGNIDIQRSVFNQNLNGAINFTGTASIANTTISNNADYGVVGDPDGLTFIYHSTFVNNGEIGLVNLDGTNALFVVFSIFKGHSIADCSGNILTGGSGSFSDDGTCGTTAITGLDLNLVDNGGDTLTHALLLGSNAIDVGGACDLTTPVSGVDQRGFYRDNQCDAGAFEYMGQDITATPTATATYTATATATFTATQTATPTLTSSPTPSATVELPTETPSDTPTETVTPDGTATVESSPTDIPSATATDVPSSTPTDIPTATTQAAIELLVNGDFESDLTGWTQKNPTNDKVKCNKPGKPIAFEGECAYQFKSSVGEISKLQQTVASGGINANDTLTFNGYAYPKGSDVNTSIKVTVKYADANLEKGKIVIKLNAATADYQLQTDSLTLIATPSQIKVQVSNKGTSGKVLFDALSLTQTTSIARLIPLPRP